MGDLRETPQEVAHFRHHASVGEEHFVAEAPAHDGRAVAVDADHVAQRMDHGLLERELVGLLDGIGAGAAPDVRAAHAGRAPEAVLAPEHHADAVAEFGEHRMMRIMTAADDVESGFLHVADVALESGVGHGVAPARAVLMHVRAVEIAVLAVQEESLVGGPFDRTESELVGEAVVEERGLRVDHGGLGAVQVRRLGRPAFRVLHLRRHDLDLADGVRRHHDALFGRLRDERAGRVIDGGLDVDR